MAKKGAKATRKFAASGQLKKQIQARHKHQELKKRVERRKGKKGGHNVPRKNHDENDEDQEESNDGREVKGKKYV